MRSTLRAVDLFCGAGGLTLGLKQAGYRVIGGVENDPLACETYRLNHSDTILWECDICQLPSAAIMRDLNLGKGELELLAACPPCQGFSTIRTKNGRRRNRDRRNSLILEVLRLTKGLMPKSLMLENVPGLVKSKHFEHFCDVLKSIGYKVKWEIFDAADFGVAQRRRRVVLIAGNSHEPEFARPARRRKTVRDVLARLSATKRSNDPLHHYEARHSREVIERIKQIPLDGGSRSALASKEQLACHKRLVGFRDVYGRMSWDKPAPTMTGGCINPSKGRFLHPSENRAISLREAALLQSFPRTYRFSMRGGRYAVAKMIGNALPPEFIRRHAKALAASISR